MIEYVNQFFKDFDYRAQDAAHLSTCLQKMYANDQARAHFEQALAAYDADMNCDYGQIMDKARQAGSAVGVRSYTSELLLFICLSRKLRERYVERGIDLSIWHNSMLDLRYKLDECLAVYGICGSFVAGWFPGFFNLTRFALGRLQFELWDLDRDYQKGEISLAKGTKTINMHIPRSGQPLSPALYEDAFARAKAFFREQCPGEKVPFVCHSWLLFPEQADFLHEKSNVRKFLSEFDIIAWSYSNGEDLWRLFDTMEQHPDRLPTDSGLRRDYVERLKKGGRVGSGYGILFR